MTNTLSPQTVRTDRIVIAGLPRSGTTYVGKILDAHPDIRMVLEPLNEEFGLRAVDGQFPYVGERGGPDRDAAARLLDDVVALRGGWRRFVMSRGANRSLPRKALKVAFGSRVSWDWRIDAAAESMGKARVPVQCIKDPFATFSLDYLWASHGVRSLCMVRHPGAYFHSFVTQPWNFGIGRLSRAQSLRADFGQTIPTDLWVEAHSDRLAYCAVLWKLMAQYVHTHRDTIKVVRHEDFAADVRGQVEEICDYFALTIAPSMERYIESTTSGSDVAPEYLRVHSFVRDSARVADHWRSAIDPSDEAVLRDAIGDDLRLLYGEW